jgi:hypothetical protein
LGASVRTFYPGGSYVDAHPSGVFAVLYPGSHLQSHLGRIDLPPGDEPLYHRITTVGGFRIAGQAHASLRTLEWIAGSWIDRPQACGVSPVIYDRSGVLHISDCSVGSQGYRYVDPDNRIHSGDETYGSPFGLSEWSAYGGLFIGQGHDGGGVLVYDGSVLRVLESGDGRFVRVQGEGEAVAVSFVRPDGAVIVQTTLAELRALPVRAVPSPVPVPVPVPHPIPEPPMSLPDPSAVKAALDRARQPFPPIVGNVEMGAILNTVAGQFPNMGMHRKDGQAIQPGTGIGISHDVLRYLPPGDDFGWWADVLGATGAGLATPLAPSWLRSSDDRRSFVPPTAVNAPPPSPGPIPPTTTPSTPPGDLSDILRRLAALEQRPVSIDGVRIALKTQDGHVVCAEGGGGREVNATRTGVGPWETFAIEVQP